MSVTWTRVVVIAVVSAFGLASPSFASLFEPVGDRQLVCETTAIVRGQVTDVQSTWDAQHTAIWTTAMVTVTQGHRGSLTRGTAITVKEVGGTVGDLTIEAEGFPTFRTGEEVVLLLRPWDDGSGAYRVWGYGRGMFMVTRRGTLGATATRHDVQVSGRTTMFVDLIDPTTLLESLERELRTLAFTCPGGSSR